MTIIMGIAFKAPANIKETKRHSFMAIIFVQTMLYISTY